MSLLTLQKRMARIDDSVPERPLIGCWNCHNLPGRHTTSMCRDDGHCLPPLNCPVCERAFPFERIVYPNHVESPEGR